MNCPFYGCAGGPVSGGVSDYCAKHYLYAQGSCSVACGRPKSHDGPCDGVAQLKAREPFSHLSRSESRRCVVQWCARDENHEGPCYAFQATPVDWPDAVRAPLRAGDVIKAGVERAKLVDQSVPAWATDEIRAGVERAIRVTADQAADERRKLAEAQGEVRARVEHVIRGAERAADERRRLTEAQGRERERAALERREIVDALERERDTAREQAAVLMAKLKATREERDHKALQLELTEEAVRRLELARAAKPAPPPGARPSRVFVLAALVLAAGLVVAFWTAIACSVKRVAQAAVEKIADRPAAVTPVDRSGGAWVERAGPGSWGEGWSGGDRLTTQVVRDSSGRTRNVVYMNGHVVYVYATAVPECAAPVDSGGR